MRRLFRILAPMITPIVMALLGALARRVEQPELRQTEHAPEARSTALVHQPRQGEAYQLSQRQSSSARGAAVDFLSDVLAETYRKVRTGQERTRR